MMVNTEAGIAAQRAGNFFFISIFLCSIIILTVVAVVTGDPRWIVPSPLLLVFFLFLRRAYVRDRLRKIAQR